MKNKNGFTLVELLAVIAILAILVIIALPNVINMYNRAQKQTFLTEVKAIYNAVPDKYLSETMKGNKLSYVSSKDDSKLNLTGDSSKLNYCIKINSNGNVSEMKIGNNKYYILLNKSNKMEDLDIDDIYDGKYVQETCNSDVELKVTKSCTFKGTLKQGAEFVDGQYTYRYKQGGDYSNIFSMSTTLKWKNISIDGWGVQLTNKSSTDSVNTSLCTDINDKPIVSMSGMFSKSSASSIDFSGFDTSNVVSMDAMFAFSKAQYLNVSNFNTSNVTTMKGMFGYSDAINIDGLEKFDTSKVLNMSEMFYGCKSKKLNLNNFNTSKVTNMANMFRYAQATTLDVSSFDTSRVYSMLWMFLDSSATQIKGLENFNTSNVTNMGGMFQGTKAKSLDLSSFNTSKVTNMFSMFQGCSITSLDLSSFDTSKVKDMSGMLENIHVDEIKGLNKLNTSNVTNMRLMFGRTSTSNGTLDLSNFNTSNVTKMDAMFQKSPLLKVDLSSFNTSNVTDMMFMFSNAEIPEINGLDKFNTSKVTNMAYMFYNSKAKSLDLSSFDTSSVTDISYMFNGSSATTVYVRTETDMNKFKGSWGVPSGLNFILSK